MKVWAGSEKRRLYREARQYADLHGWQPISDTALEKLQAEQPGHVCHSGI